MEIIKKMKIRNYEYSMTRTRDGYVITRMNTKDGDKYNEAVEFETENLARRYMFQKALNDIEFFKGEKQ